MYVYYVCDTGETKIEQYLKTSHSISQSQLLPMVEGEQVPFSTTIRIARQYLAPPLTSFASERLLSTTGDICDEKETFGSRKS